MSGRRLHLEVTWPACRTVGPIPRSGQLGDKLWCNRRKLRRDLVRVTDDAVYIRGLFGPENRVSDVDRYYIVRRENAECAVEVRQHEVAAGPNPPISTYPYVDRPVATADGLPTLVIVLESPHRDEYGESVHAPLGPARGRTGARIHKFLCAVVNSCPPIRCTLFDRAPVRVVISNPIPFQTSAYAIQGGRSMSRIGCATSSGVSYGRTRR